MISFDDAERAQWGLDWLDLPPTTAPLCFSDVPGFTTPACETVSTTSGVTTVAQGDFALVSMLSVTTVIQGTTSGLPSVISLNGVPSSVWGVNVELPAGPVEVCWGDVAGYTTPVCPPSR